MEVSIFRAAFMIAFVSPAALAATVPATELRCDAGPTPFIISKPEVMPGSNFFSSQLTKLGPAAIAEARISLQARIWGEKIQFKAPGRLAIELQLVEGQFGRGNWYFGNLTPQGQLPIPVACTPVKAVMGQIRELHAPELSKLSFPDQKVLLLKQLHYMAGMEKIPAEMEALAKNQFQIVRFIENSPGAELFLESLVEDAGPEQYQQLAFNPDPQSPVKLSQSIFPRGIPANFMELNVNQKSVLATYGAAKLLFYLHLVPYLHKTILEQDNMRIRKRTDEIKLQFGSFDRAMQESPEFRFLVAETREDLAVQQIASFQNSPANRGQPLFLIFGEKHQFARY